MTMLNSSPPKKTRGAADLGRIGDARLDLVPTLADCKPGLRPTEFNVIVALAKMPKQIGSIHLPDEVQENMGLAMQVARIVAVSPLAFNYAEWPPNAQKPEPGDIAWIGRFAGGEFEGRDGNMYRIIKDRDVGAVIEPLPVLKAQPMLADELTA
jgi:co-chaperonin GroES (HSP10)